MPLYSLSLPRYAVFSIADFICCFADTLCSFILLPIYFRRDAACSRLPFFAFAAILIFYAALILMPLMLPPCLLFAFFSSFDDAFR